MAGRNPLGAHAASRATIDYAGAERGWPVQYTRDVCARLELVRGSLSSSAADEHYPFNPDGAFRHPEGWTGFNAAYNVSLAVLVHDRTSLNARPAGRGRVRLSLAIPRGFGERALRHIDLRLKSGGNKRTIRADWTGEAFVTAAFDPAKLVKATASVEVAYGWGIFESTLRLRRSADGRWGA